MQDLSKRQQQQQQGFLAFLQEIQSKLLHFQYSFFPASFWHHPHVQHCLATRWMTRNRIRKHHLLIELATVYCDSTPRSSLQSWLRPPPTCSRLGSPVTLVLQTVTVKGTGCYSFTCYLQSDGFEVLIIHVQDING